MFTGLVEGIGKFIGKRIDSGYQVLTIEPPFETSSLNVGDSVAINGCCLTVTKILAGQFEVMVSKESLDKTTLGKLKINDYINLERSLKVGHPIGGHFVTGHVDDIAGIKNIERQAGLTKIEISCDKRLSPYLVEKGSIAVDGVSLTVIDPNQIGQNCSFSVAVIPHTLESTTLGSLGIGDSVNLETDILGKYVAKQLGKQDKGITEEFLKEHGF